jgi:CheY-like chemotaxis protein
VAIAKVLLVDDDEIVRFGLAELLENKGFEITAAASVPEALKHISSETYHVLLRDLHMPGAGDGLTVVSAMRHANPRAVTLLLSAFPEITSITFESWYSGAMATSEILTAIDAQIARLQQARDALAGSSPARRRGRPPASSSAAPTTKRRTLSPSARKKIAEAQRKRWSKQKAAAKK